MHKRVVKSLETRGNKTHAKKKKVLIELEKCLGIVTTACLKLKIGRKTFYQWYNTDDDFKAKVDDIENIVIDFVEGSLYKQMQKADTTAMIFFLKTKGRKRGWGEYLKMDHSFDEDKDKYKESLAAKNKNLKKIIAQDEV